MPPEQSRSQLRLGRFLTVCLVGSCTMVIVGVLLDNALGMSRSWFAPGSFLSTSSLIALPMAFERLALAGRIPWMVRQER